MFYSYRRNSVDSVKFFGAATILGLYENVTPDNRRTNM